VVIADVNSEGGSAVAGVIDGTIYVAGGLRGTAVAQVSAYDPLADRWDTTLPPLPAPRDHACGGVLDGKLYVAVGENANRVQAQDPNLVFGKLLRFNDDCSIPSDNPFFATRTGQARAIWASGLRNPFTFAVQPGTGRIHINDVGENTWEEINLGVAGANYGWPASEGLNNVGSGITGPLFTYDHDNGVGPAPAGFFSGCSIIGGAFYPDSGPFPPAYRGSYYFTDYCSLRVGRIDLANGNAAYSFGSLPDQPVGMLVANDGALLVLTRSGITRFSAP